MQIVTAIYVLVVVLVLFGATIFVHELGHFLLARRHGLRIERFSIGFGPKLWGFTRDGVEYRVSLFPFGGYVALPQMAPLDDEEKAKFNPPLPEVGAWSKIVVAVAGAVFNIAFGLILACVIWWVGVPIESSQLDLRIGYVPQDSPEYAAGLRMDDEIVAVNGRSVKDWTEVTHGYAFQRGQTVSVEYRREGVVQPSLTFIPERDPILHIRLPAMDPRATPKIKQLIPSAEPTPAQLAGLKAGDLIRRVDGIDVVSVGHLLDLIGERAERATELVLSRDGRELTVTVTPRLETESKRGKIGVVPVASSPKVDVYPNPWKQFKEVILMMAKTITALVHHKETGVGAKDLSGPVGIGHMLWRIIPSDIRLALSFTVLLNINLAILNLLPIPVLDGGHIMFALIEWVRRKPLSYRFAAVTQTVFAVLLISFILYVTYFDVQRLGRIEGLFRPKKDKEPPAMKFESPADSTSPVPDATKAPATP